jgi:hypothetical protein
MKREQSYKFFLVLAIVVAGVVCFFLPEKKVLPTANMGGVVNENVSADTVGVEKENFN